jgi:hypothetical protein
MERDHLEDLGELWANNIKVDLQDVGWGGMDWIAMVYCSDRWRALVYAAMNPIKYGEFVDYLSMS